MIARGTSLRNCGWLLGGVLSLACQSKKQDPGAAEVTPVASGEAQKPSAEEFRKLSKILPPAELVQSHNNPQGLPKYAGATGTVRGVVRAVGDTAPVTLTELSDVKLDCTTPKSTFGTLFREGKDRALADVLIAVTGYQGYVPTKSDAVLVQGDGCAWQSRTVVLTFGQSLRVAAKDNRPYVPELMGQQMPVQLFAMPGAEPVDLVPRKPGRFLLVDSLRIYNRADVFVLTYPTTAVTGLDGHFEITGIPEGKAKLNAFLPATSAVVEREVEIRSGVPVELSLELPFDSKKFEESEKTDAP